MQVIVAFLVIRIAEAYVLIGCVFLHYPASNYGQLLEERYYPQLLQEKALETINAAIGILEKAKIEYGEYFKWTIDGVQCIDNKIAEIESLVDDWD